MNLCLPKSVTKYIDEEDAQISKHITVISFRWMPSFLVRQLFSITVTLLLRSMLFDVNLNSIVLKYLKQSTMTRLLCWVQTDVAKECNNFLKMPHCPHSKAC